MSLVVMPAIVRDQIAEIGLRPIYPQQIEHQSVYTLQTQTLTRGGGTWQGEVVWPESSAGNAAFVEALEGWVSVLGGVVNYTELYHGRRTIPDSEDNTVTVQTVLYSGGLIQHELSGSITAPTGTYLTINNRLFCVSVSHGGNTYTLSPQLRLATGSSVFQGGTVKAKSSGDLDYSTLVPGGANAYTWSWIEQL